MDPTPTASDKQEPEQAAPAAPGGPRAGRRRIGTRAWVAIGIALGVVLLLAAGLYATASPTFCGSCHEIAPRAASWKQSPHADVPCVRCHVPPRPWYESPQQVVDFGRLVTRDIYKHATGDYTDPVDQRPPGVAPTSDAVCLQCHDVNRKATSGFRILINHPEHAKRNGSCVSCHIRTGHPLPTRGQALSLMGQCFTCHGLGKTAKAPARCNLCHPPGYRLIPASHVAKKWLQRHGAIAKTDRQECAMCHQPSFCTDCHGLEMPHPAGWAKGTTGHAIYAQRDRTVCAKCHGSNPDMCSMCHHKSYDPAKGTWVKQHFQVVQKEGPLFCIESCHSPVFCARCHVQ